MASLHASYIDNRDSTSNHVGRDQINIFNSQDVERHQKLKRVRMHASRPLHNTYRSTQSDRRQAAVLLASFLTVVLLYSWPFSQRTTSGFQSQGPVNIIIAYCRRHDESLEAPSESAVPEVAANVIQNLPHMTVVPPAPAIFYGRDEFVNDILDAIVSRQTSSGSAHVTIMGSGGMGKTSVALAVINHPRVLQLFGDGRHWVPCDQTPTISLFLELLSRILLVKARSGNRLSDIMSSLQENNVHRIILLDNFETLWDPIETKSACEAVLSSLASLSNITVLLTMRGSMRPSGVQWTLLPAIEPLSLEAARRTFMAISTYVDSQLDGLLCALDCVALAVTLVATVGQTGVMPSELLKSWEMERTPLLDVGADRLKSVDSSIRLSLRSTSMAFNPDAFTVLSVLAHLPGGIGLGNLQRVVPAIRKIDAAERTLLRTALAYRTSDDRLQTLSPIRSHMLQHYPLHASNVQALRSFYFRLSEVGGHNAGTEILLSLEEINTRSIIVNALEYDVSVDAVYAAIHYSHPLHWYIPSTAVLCKAINSIRNHASPELHLLMPRCLVKLGILFIRVDDYPRAISTLKVAEESFKAVADWDGAANCRRQLSEVYRLLGKIERDSVTTAQDSTETFGDCLAVLDHLHARGCIDCIQNKNTEAMAVLAQDQTVYTTPDDRICLAEASIGVVGEMR